jgi:flagellar hook-associated protein 3 FlgL
MSNFRVTQRTLSANVLHNLQGNLGKMSRIQEQLSTGRQISRPSDSPTGTVAALRFKADIRRSEQMLRNADDALGWLGTADGALTEGLSLVNRARELVLTGSNATVGPDGRRAIAAEIDGLRQNALALANTQYLGRPLFAGTADGTSAYGPDGAYLGIDGRDGIAGGVSRTVSNGVTVRVNMTGPEIFGPPQPIPKDPTLPVASGDLFAVLEKISADLRDGSPELGDETLRALDAAMTRMMNALATVGARYNQVETMRTRTSDSILQQTNSLSEVESVDLPEKVVQLQMQEVAYQAALSATQRVIQPSLVSFLR